MKRRNFISKTLAGATGLAVTTSSALTYCSIDRKVDDPVMALIGCGKRGMQLLNALSELNQQLKIKYVCDVNAIRGHEAVEYIRNKFGYSPVFLKNMKDAFADKGINTVIIATPEHWHALAALWACQAELDIFLEAIPVLTIGEGQKLVEAARKYKCKVQVGFQHRSAEYCSKARDYISGGHLGQIIHVKTYNLMGCGNWQQIPDSPVPDGLDWNSWLGPAPLRPYNRGIYLMDGCGGWDNYWEYSGGKLSHYASHSLDLARMVLGDPGPPRAVHCFGGNWAYSSEREVPEFQVITYNYESFTMTCESGSSTSYMADPVSKARMDEKTYPEWQKIARRVEIYGTKGLMYLGVDGNGWQVLDADGKVLAEEKGEKSDKLHLQNFIDNRGKNSGLNSTLEQACSSAILVHMGNIAYRAGNSYLSFNPEKGHFIEDENANAMINKSYREGYELPGKL